MFIPTTYASPTTGVTYSLTELVPTLSYLSCYDTCLSNNMTLATAPEEDRKGIVAMFSSEGAFHPNVSSDVLILKLDLQIHGGQESAKVHSTTGPLSMVQR